MHNTHVLFGTDFTAPSFIWQEREGWIPLYLCSTTAWNANYLNTGLGIGMVFGNTGLTLNGSRRSAAPDLVHKPYTSQITN